MFVLKKPALFFVVPIFLFAFSLLPPSPVLILVLPPFLSPHSCALGGGQRGAEALGVSLRLQELATRCTRSWGEGGSDLRGERCSMGTLREGRVEGGGKEVEGGRECEG